VAEKRAVKILHVPADATGQILASDQRKKLEKAVTPLATEHVLIFTDTAKTKQIWLWTSRLPGKPISYRELIREKEKSNELLLQKLSSISFTISEEESLDITGVVERLRDALDRDKVTKRFYDQFKTQKDAFRKFIKGITDSGLLDWYTSLMLNRLMFCYFLQRKGFLDGDHDYLSNRLERVRDEFGKEKFHSFYKSFLRRLFHEGLGQPKNERADELKKLIGDVPYLNGGIFEEHKIEREHPGLHIPDEAFEKVFAFLDDYDWHLDDRPIASGKEINPEILGYVFEKYTNQKEMGAYYTKEDITDYIAKNCIIPFLLDAAGDKLSDASWNLLREDPDRYIYPALGHGIFCDYPTSTKLAAPLPLPDYVENGIETSKPDLRKRRARWNESATSELGLPTEIWRETVARRQRCEELQRKLRAGEVHAINDLITLNLNVRQFAQDVVENAAADLLLALFKAIRKVSVLDPTCGSGAFLFAALNILEPLYRASLDRMRALIGDWDARGDKSHPNYRKDFGTVLDQAARHPNENYFIFKSIIVHNLYGVDIMEEAVEICKLRLFLKLAAQLEPGQEIEPLPDIDFNIRAGNTLVGYASRDEVRRVYGSSLRGVEHSIESFEAIDERAQFLDNLFCEFQRKQDDFDARASELREAKELFERELKPLRSDLDHFLAADYNMRNVASDEAFKKWRDSHRPFHWFVEFYGILQRGGFDVIIGNPPYVDYSKVRDVYAVSELLFETLDCGNLYTLVVERSKHLVSSRYGFILPLSSTNANGNASFQTLLRTSAALHISHYAVRPSKLFNGVDMNLTIILGCESGPKNGSTSAFRRWPSAFREFLFATTQYTTHAVVIKRSAFPKFGEASEVSVWEKLQSPNDRIVRHVGLKPSATLAFHGFGRYWRKCILQKLSDNYQEFTVEAKLAPYAICILNSQLSYWYWIASSDCYRFTKTDALNLSVPDTIDHQKFERLSKRLLISYEENAIIQTKTARNGKVTKEKQFFPARSKSILDEIDALLAEHYGFTEEEFDFIINYDIKYRMGLSGNSGEDTGE
jgi:Eco57I restriction-modification methylase